MCVCLVSGVRVTFYIGGWWGSKPWRALIGFTKSIVRWWGSNRLRVPVLLFFTTIILQFLICKHVCMSDVLGPSLSLSTSYRVVSQLLLRVEPRKDYPKGYYQIPLLRGSTQSFYY